MSTKPPSSAPEAPLRLEQYLPYRLNVVAFHSARALGRIYDAEFGIGIPEWRVVAQLGEFGKLTSRDIGELNTGGWDGTFKGAAQQVGTFVYYITARDVNNKVLEKKGNLTLIR